MNKPFQSFHYDIEVVTPVHIGAAKENDYILGQDYFYDDGYYCLVDKRKVIKTLTPQQLNDYSKSLMNDDNISSAQIIKNAIARNPELIIHKSYCPFKPIQSSVRKHISDGLGNLIIPGSSLKGALSGIIGKYLMKMTNLSEFTNISLFGGINNSIMRYLQVGDVTFKVYGEVTLQKIFSADLNHQYNRNDIRGLGRWKNQRVGGHDEVFNPAGFVTAAEMLIEGSTSSFRINWADALLKLIQDNDKHANMRLYDSFSKNNLLKIIQNHTNEYLNQEINFFTLFPNEDFSDAIEILEEIKEHNNHENSALLRLGSGSGYHAIIGNWKYNNHAQTGQAEDRHRNLMNAIKYKTRKVAFYESDENIILTFPGFVKLTAHS